MYSNVLNISGMTIHGKIINDSGLHSYCLRVPDRLEHAIRCLQIPDDGNFIQVVIFLIVQSYFMSLRCVERSMFRLQSSSLRAQWK